MNRGFFSVPTAALAIALLAVVCLPSSSQRNAKDARRNETAKQANAKKLSFAKSFTQGGLTLDLEVDHQDLSRKSGEFREGDDVNIRLAVRDAATGNALAGLNPAMWLSIVRLGEQTDAKGCAGRVQGLLSSGLLGRAELDLNVYHVLALNADSTITVVDPLFGYGGTRLLALIKLKSPGEDWVITSDQTKLFVSMPDSNQIAFVETGKWSLVSNIDVPSNPTRLSLQPDEAYLWVSREGPSESGVSVVSLREMKTVANIQTGRGKHQLAFTDDSRFAFVTNEESRTVSIIDIRRLVKAGDVQLEGRPSSIAFSGLAQAAYVSSSDGSVIVIGRTKQNVIAKMKAESGLGQIRFAPGNRFAFVVNPERNSVLVIDAAVNRIIQRATVDKGPDQLTFSSNLAYVRHRDSEQVLMIPLSEIGGESKPLSVVDFPGGQNPLGKSSRPSSANAIVQAGDDNAVLVANPGDKAIYYYQEGMAAPMGNFSNYGREPRAVLVVDRSLRQLKPGVYTSVARLPRAGSYKVAIFINSPRIVECLDFSIAADAENAEPEPPRIEVITSLEIVQPGKPIRLSFRLTDAASGKPINGLRDVVALTIAPGIWQERTLVEPQVDGVYSLSVTPTESAAYNVYVTSPSAGLPYTRVLAFEVRR